jgi:hypothetical protein
VLELKRRDSVEDPIETENRVDYHRRIVHPNLLVSQLFAKEWVLCSWVTKTPVVVDVPKTRVNGVDNSESDKHRTILTSLIDAIYAQRHIKDDRGKVFAAIEKVGEFVACIPISPDTLQSTPDARQT